MTAARDEHSVLRRIEELGGSVPRVALARSADAAAAAGSAPPEQEVLIGRYRVGTEIARGSIGIGR